VRYHVPGRERIGTNGSHHKESAEMTVSVTVYSNVG